MPEENIDVEASEVAIEQPVQIKTALGLCTILDAEGDPSGPRLLLPDGTVTSLANSGGIVERFFKRDRAALDLASAEIVAKAEAISKAASAPVK